MLVKSKNLEEKMSIILVLIILMLFISLYPYFRTSHYYSVGEVFKKVQFRIAVLLSTFIIILPINVMLGLNGILGTYIIIVILTTLTNKLFSAIYLRNSLPSLYSVLHSLLFSLFVIVLLNPLLYCCLDLFYGLELIDCKHYSYFFYYINYLIFDTFFTEPDGVYMVKRTPEVTEELRKRRNDSALKDYYCKKAYDKYLQEQDPKSKKDKLRVLFDLVGKRRDVCKGIDSLAGNKSSSNAFKNKAYSKFISNLINSLRKK